MTCSSPPSFYVAAFANVSTGMLCGRVGVYTHIDTTGGLHLFVSSAELSSVLGISVVVPGAHQASPEAVLACAPTPFLGGLSSGVSDSVGIDIYCNLMSVPTVITDKRVSPNLKHINNTKASAAALLVQLELQSPASFAPESSLREYMSRMHVACNVHQELCDLLRGTKWFEFVTHQTDLGSEPVFNPQLHSPPPPSLRCFKVGSPVSVPVPNLILTEENDDGVQESKGDDVFDMDALLGVQRSRKQYRQDAAVVLEVQKTVGGKLDPVVGLDTLQLFSAVFAARSGSELAGLRHAIAVGGLPDGSGYFYPLFHLPRLLNTVRHVVRDRVVATDQTLSHAICQITTTLLQRTGPQTAANSLFISAMFKWLKEEEEEDRQLVLFTLASAAGLAIASKARRTRPLVPLFL